MINEKQYVTYWTKRLKNEFALLEQELPTLFQFYGVRFLPKRWLRFDSPELSQKISILNKSHIAEIGKSKYHYYCLYKQA